MKTLSILGSLILNFFAIGSNFAIADGTPNLTDFARDERGGYELFVNQVEAEKYCQDLNLRLPTIRELALYSQSLGAAGISDSAKEGYSHIRASDAAGNPDHFYFSRKGYRHPDEAGGYVLWSSSRHSDDSDYAYFLYGSDGGIGSERRLLPDKIYFTVRCVR